MTTDVDPIEAELEELDAEEGKLPSSAVRRFLPAVLASVAIVGFAGAVWYAYSTGVREGSEFAAPTLKPDGPSKVAPKNPGGQQIANQDKLVYGKIDKSGETRKVERLLPPPENPLPAPIAKKTPPPPLPAPKLEVPKTPPTSELPATPKATAPPAPPAPQINSGQPKAEKPSDKTSAASKLATITPSAGQKAAKQSPSPKPGPAAPKPAQQVATKAAAPLRAPKAAAKPDPATGYRIQIGSLRSEEAAKKAWESHLKKHGPVLSKLTLLVKRAELGKKGVYFRVQAGPLENKEAAKRICDELKRKKIGCFVVRP
jgi:hypothetical protein